MLSRVTTTLLVLVILLVCSTALAAGSSPVGVKTAAAEPNPASEVAVPATTEWGMLVMILLVMTASSAAMLGDGFPGWMLPSVRVASRPSPPPAPSPAVDVAVEEEPRSRRSRNKSTFQRVSQGKHGSGQTAQRSNLSRSRRRRDGPGCRGIR